VKKVLCHGLPRKVLLKKKKETDNRKKIIAGEK